MYDGSIFESVSDSFLPVSWGVSAVCAMVLSGFFYALQRFAFARDHTNERRLYFASTLIGAFAFLCWFIVSVRTYQAAQIEGEATSIVQLIGLVGLGLLYGTIVAAIMFAFLSAATMLYVFVIRPVHEEVIVDAVEDVSLFLKGEEKPDPELEAAFVETRNEAYTKGIDAGREMERDRKKEREEEEARINEQREREKAEREVHHQREGARMKCDMFYQLHTNDLSNVGFDEKKFWRVFDQYLPNDIEPEKIAGRSNEFLKMLEQRVSTATPGKKS